MKAAGSYRLVLQGLPVVGSLQDLSDLTHLSPGLLHRLSRFPGKHYHRYQLPKKGGGVRLISQPSREMKALQGWILRAVLDRLLVSSASKGFEIGASIVANAQPHVGCNALLCLDIDDFFSSIRAGWVYTIFREAGYSTATAAMFTGICTLDGSLPQGAPSSPKLANLACWKLDRRIMGFVGRRGIMYTRYADDMSFSSFSYRQLIRSRPVLEEIIRSEGFALNRAKTRISGPARARRVTGMIVHEAGVGVGRKKYRELRARIHRQCSITVANCEDQEIAELNGWLAYVRGVDAARASMLYRNLGALQRRFPKSAVSLLKLKPNK